MFLKSKWSCSTWAYRGSFIPLHRSQTQSINVSSLINTITFHGYVINLGRHDGELFRKRYYKRYSDQNLWQGWVISNSLKCQCFVPNFTITLPTLGQNLTSDQKNSKKLMKEQLKAGSYFSSNIASKLFSQLLQTTVLSTIHLESCNGTTS